MENPINITVPKRVHEELEDLKAEGDTFYEVVEKLLRTAEGGNPASPMKERPASNRSGKAGGSITITVPGKIRDGLEELKLHRREPLYEVILRLLEGIEPGFRSEGGE